MLFYKLTCTGRKLRSTKSVGCEGARVTACMLATRGAAAGERAGLTKRRLRSASRTRLSSRLLLQEQLQRQVGLVGFLHVAHVVVVALLSASLVSLQQPRRLPRALAARRLRHALPRRRCCRRIWAQQSRQCCPRTPTSQTSATTEARYGQGTQPSQQIVQWCAL